MSERILRALMQLFAIIAKVDGMNNTGRLIVQSFLKQQLNNEQVETYLRLFDEYLEAHHQVSKKKDGTAKRTSLNSVKVLKICTQINLELEQTQKIIVLIRLLEFIYSSNEISEQEFDFVSTVANTFHIPNDEFLELKSFVESKREVMLDTPNILIINNQTAAPTHNKHIYCEGLYGEIRVIQIDTVGIYALRVFGDIELQLNGQSISKDRVYILTPGSSIRNSRIKPIYYSDIIGRFLADEHTAKISFEASNLQYRFRSGRLGLHNINIHEESGTLFGIMGGSGAGKSTLLNVLNGTEAPSSGKVLINNINIHEDRSAMEGVIGFVSQDDLLMEELTVYQNLFYNAKLCFGNLSEEEIAKKCMGLLADLGLTETRDLKVGSPLEKVISGGQRKRLNIALELIREPAVLFVDEPTSGLSSRDSENIMDLLKELALKGKLIFVVIHQPSSDIFKMFDRLLILDVGGYPIYYGNPVDAVAYFKRLVDHVNAEESECPSCGNVNPEVIFNIIENKVLDEYGNLTHNRKTSPIEWNAHYKDLIERNIIKGQHHEEMPENIFKIPNKLQQFRVFMVRDVLSKLTNTQYLLINFLEAPVLALILAYLVRYFNTDADTTRGYIYRENENIPAYMFMAVVVALFIGLMVSAQEIIRDRKIRKRESFLHLSKGSYLWSKVFIMFVLSAIQTLSFVLVGNALLGIKGMWLDYWAVLFSVSCFANMLGLNISAAFNSAVTIYILIPFLIIPQLLLSGVIVKFDKLNPSLAKQGGVPFSGEIMASRWAYEALAVNQFKANAYERRFYKYDKAISIAQYKKVYWIPKLQNKLAKIESNLHNPAMADEMRKDLALVHYEIQREQLISKKVKCSVLPQIGFSTYNDLVHIATKDYLTSLNDYYILRENNARAARDKVITDLTHQDPNQKKFHQLQEDYENESLNQLVLNSNDFGERCLEKDGKLIQRIDPIYLDPVDSNLGRAHFFAPQKHFLGAFYPTFWFNIAVLWTMSLVLILTLYFNLFKKAVMLLGRLRLRIKVRA